MSGHGGCKHDINNFQHLCTLIAKPCAYLGHIDECPYLAEENGHKGVVDKSTVKKSHHP